MITAEEFGSWKHDEITKEVFKQLEKNGSIALDAILSICASSRNADDMVGVSYQAGYIKGLSELLDLHYEDLNYEEFKDEA